jgi:hypothetical protein
VQLSVAIGPQYRGADVEDLPYQTLDEISIDRESSALIVQYAQEDQGGKVVTRFRIPSIRMRLPSFVAGYHASGRLREHEIAWEDIPTRVREDISPWLEAQRVAAESSAKRTLQSFLVSMQEVLR